MITNILNNLAFIIIKLGILFVLVFLVGFIFNLIYYIRIEPKIFNILFILIGIIFLIGLNFFGIYIIIMN